jgi:hypothetical protein
VWAKCGHAATINRGTASRRQGIASAPLHMPPEAERPSRGTFPGVVLPTSRSRSTGFGLDDTVSAAATCSKSGYAKPDRWSEAVGSASAGSTAPRAHCNFVGNVTGQSSGCGGRVRWARNRSPIDSICHRDPDHPWATSFVRRFMWEPQCEIGHVGSKLSSPAAPLSRARSAG